MARNKQQDIAKAAVKLFEQKGYHATSVQDIADEVGLQKGSLYHYIESKEDLLLQIAQQAMTQFNQRLEEILNSQLSAREKLIKSVENHLTVSVNNLETTTVLLREAFSLGENQHVLIQSSADKYVDLWTRILEEGCRAGEFVVEEPKITALAILGACNWVYRWYRVEGRMTASEVAALFANLFLDGIAVER